VPWHGIRDPRIELPRIEIMSVTAPGWGEDKLGPSPTANLHGDMCQDVSKYAHLDQNETRKGLAALLHETCVRTMAKPARRLDEAKRSEAGS